MVNKSFRSIVYVNGIKAQRSISLGTYKWRELLQEVLKNNKNDSILNLNDGSLFFLDFTLLNNQPLSEFLAIMKPDVKVEIRIHDYDSIFSDLEKHIYWIANIRKICGYYLLLRFEGMDHEGDEKHDFWINIGSTELKHVGYCASSSHCELIPPESIRKRHSDWSKYMLCKLHACKTLTTNWPNHQEQSINNGKFKVGNRLELLDRLESTQIRPARVIHQLGKRICVRVLADDTLPIHLTNQDDIQVTDGVWLDESSGLIFPVGWATLNNYTLQSNNSYLNHCQAIVKALDESKAPLYASFDITQERFNDWKENKANESSIHWKAGTKFECLDPLNSSFLELRVATCVEVLKNGYLKIGFDGLEMEEESLPIHCTSPLLFPAGYGVEYNINVRGPLETEEFSWKEYLRQCQAEAASPTLFDIVPLNEMKKIKIGSKLEAADMCEPHLICPATVVDIKGRLLRIHYDGWSDDFDQFFDYRSRDIFPIGWCEMYGYKLEMPKITESPIPLKKPKKII